MLEYKGLVNMGVQVRFMSLPDIPLKEMVIDTGSRDGISFNELLDRVSKEVKVDFAANRHNYMYMVNSTVVRMEHMACTNIRSSDSIVIMPVICGG